MAETIARTGRGRRDTTAPARAHRRLPFAAQSLAVAVALLWCNGALAAETQVLLLRGWFGVFSTGMDGLAAELKAKGIKTEVAGHLYWSTAVKEILKERAAGKTRALVLVGHSQGANNVIDMARSLEPPFMQNPVPANVVRAVNYFQSPGWGAPLTAEPGFHGKLSNVDVGDDWTIAHISIDKSARIHAEISRDIAALSQAKEGPQDGAANPLTAAAPQSPQKKFPPQAEAQ